MEKIELKGTFKILDYRISHKLLLLRSTEIINNEISNIDIIFEMIFYLEITDHFKDLTIELACQNEYTYVNNKCFFNLDATFDKVFKLQSEDKCYFIGCWDYKINKNSMLPLQSSIVN